MKSDIIYTRKTQNNLVQSSETVLSCLKKLEKLDVRVLFVFKAQKFIGTLTEGDIRRALVKGYELKSTVLKITNSECLIAESNQEKNEFENKMNALLINAVPVISNKKLIGMFCRIKKSSEISDISALIMAGGKGTRLAPITNSTPKPLIKIGGEPIIELLIRKLVEQGINKIYISTNYKSDKLISDLKYAHLLGAKIKFINEKKPLGTAAAIGKVKLKKSQLLLVLNSDILLDIDFNKLFNEHKRAKSDMTLVTILNQVNINFGVIKEKISSKKIEDFIEKPIWHVKVYAGVALIGMRISELVSGNTPLDIPELVRLALEKKRNIRSFNHVGYWQDLGTHEKLKEVSNEFDVSING